MRRLIWKGLAGFDWAVIELEMCFPIGEFRKFHRGRISFSTTGYCSDALIVADSDDDGKFLSLGQDLFETQPEGGGEEFKW